MDRDGGRAGAIGGSLFGGVARKIDGFRFLVYLVVSSSTRETRLFARKGHLWHRPSFCLPEVVAGGGEASRGFRGGVPFFPLEG